MKGTKKGQGIKNSLAQSLVEFALVLPMLLLLILGAMDFGRMFYTKIVITNAAREGANYLAYYPSDKEGSFEAIDAEATSSNVVVIESEVQYDYNYTEHDEYESVGVSITKTVELIFDDILQFLGLLNGPIDLTSTVWMRVQ